MNLTARLSLLGAVTACFASSLPACSSGKWSHLFMDVTVTDQPTLVGPDGTPISTTWSGNATSSQDQFGITLNASNGMRLRIEFANPQSSMVFTTFKTRPFDDIFGAAPKTGEMRIAFLDKAENDVTDASGKVTLEELDAPETDTLDSGSFKLKLTFDKLVLKTAGSTSSSRSISPLDHEDGGFVADETGGYAFTGNLGAYGSQDAHESRAPSGGSSSSSSSSGGSTSGGTKDCSASAVWKGCPYDGQATPFCQAACNDPTNASKICASLNSMVENTSCCVPCN